MSPSLVPDTGWAPGHQRAPGTGRTGFPFLLTRRIRPQHFLEPNHRRHRRDDEAEDVETQGRAEITDSVERGTGSVSLGLPLAVTYLTPCVMVPNGSMPPVRLRAPPATLAKTSGFGRVHARVITTAE